MTKKNLKILIIGFGSIGERHYKNLIFLGYKDVYVFDVDRKKVESSKEPARIGHTNIVESLNPETLKGFDIVFVCNPTHLHIETAILAAQAGCHLFIEKPLSHNLKNVDKLIKICKQKNLTAMVACNFRFNEGFLKLEELVNKEKFGKALSVKVLIGQNLVTSRKGIDYKKTYAAQKNGGGVILDSGAHCVNYLLTLFGDVKKEKITGVFGNLSGLEIASEDFISFNLIHKNKVISSVILDYFSKPKKHSVEVQFEQGLVLWDFVSSKLTCFDNKLKQSSEVLLYKDFSPEDRRNDMFLKELKSFMKIVENKKFVNPQDLKQAKHVLEILQFVKKQSKEI